jgi:hypothetical protein
MCCDTFWIDFRVESATGRDAHFLPVISAHSQPVWFIDCTPPFEQAVGLVFVPGGTSMDALTQMHLSELEASLAWYGVMI